MKRDIIVNKIDFKRKEIEVDGMGNFYETKEFIVDFSIIVNEKEIHSSVTFNANEVDYKYLPAIREKLVKIIFRGDSNG